MTSIFLGFLFLKMFAYLELKIRLFDNFTFYEKGY